MSYDPTRIAFLPRWNWGMLLPSVAYGRCYRCRRPWWAVREIHHAWFKPANGQFALCEPCWVRATPEERWQAHAWVCSLSESGWSDDELILLHRAVIEAQP
jgi:hypothetical protein